MTTSSSLLPRSPSDYQYDAIVIGAGLAGLTAAASLAREGTHVLVCEQAAQPGGLFNSFWRGGYLLKNGGAVGGPKNQIGQEKLKRLHACSEWKHLYFSGDSTVMATGAPATVVSGVGAANVILRELRLQEYDSRKFTKQYVNIVEQLYRRPDYNPTDAIRDKNAYLAAAQCQGCQSPDCVAGCPAGIDIPGFLRRMEAKNYAGAARLIREKNPFGEVCGLLCAADRLCQKDCYRRDFAGKPVR